MSDLVWATLNARTRKQGLVFTLLSGDPVPRSTAQRRIRELCLKAGLQPVGWHALRHSFASHLAMAGKPIKAIQELMGHSTSDVTDRYAHLSPHTRREAIDVLDSLAEARPEKFGQPVGNALLPASAVGA